MNIQRVYYNYYIYPNLHTHLLDDWMSISLRLFCICQIYKLSPDKTMFVLEIKVTYHTWFISNFKSDTYLQIEY